MPEADALHENKGSGLKAAGAVQMRSDNRPHDTRRRVVRSDVFVEGVEKERKIFIQTLVSKKYLMYNQNANVPLNSNQIYGMNQKDFCNEDNSRARKSGQRI